MSARRRHPGDAVNGRVVVWFGCWRGCDCSSAERTHDEVPRACPEHGGELLAGVWPVAVAPGAALGFELGRVTG